MTEAQLLAVIIIAMVVGWSIVALVLDAYFEKKANRILGITDDILKRVGDIEERSNDMWDDTYDFRYGLFDCYPCKPKSKEPKIKKLCKSIVDIQTLLAAQGYELQEATSEPKKWVKAKKKKKKVPTTAEATIKESKRFRKRNF